jgi:glucose-6-phosphate isomerase
MEDRWVVDVRNALAEVIGERGIPRAVLEGLAGDARAAQAELDGRREQGEIGFADLPFDRGPAEAAAAFARDLDPALADVLVLGIGGSSLGPRALYRALCHPQHPLLPPERRGGRRLFFLENADPSTIRATLDVVDPARALALVVTKSGGTAETLAQWLVVWEAVANAVGEDRARERFVFVTDPQRGVLRRAARARDVRTFEVPPNVGGRFSVLTPVGLLPAALAGIDVLRLLDGAASAARAGRRTELFANPAHLFAAVHVAALRAGRPLHVLMPYCDRLRDLADWFRQLWAESLGKRVDRRGSVVEVGPTPIAALGAVDQHSQVQLYVEGPHDKLVTFVAVRDPGGDVPIPRRFAEEEETGYLGGATIGGLLDAERRATAAALARAGRPNLTIELSAVTPATVGALLQVLEQATAVAGTMLGIDPFDQPGVEEGKKLAFGLLGRAGFEERRRTLEEWERRGAGDARVEFTIPAPPDARPEP